MLKLGQIHTPDPILPSKDPASKITATVSSFVLEKGQEAVGLNCSSAFDSLKSREKKKDNDGSAPGVSDTYRYQYTLDQDDYAEGFMLALTSSIDNKDTTELMLSSANTTAFEEVAKSFSAAKLGKQLEKLKKQHEKNAVGASNSASTACQVFKEGDHFRLVGYVTGDVMIAGWNPFTKELTTLVPAISLPPFDSKQKNSQPIAYVRKIDRVLEPGMIIIPMTTSVYQTLPHEAKPETISTFSGGWFKKKHDIQVHTLTAAASSVLANLDPFASVEDCVGILIDHVITETTKKWELLPHQQAGLVDRQNYANPSPQGSATICGIHLPTAAGIVLQKVLDGVKGYTTVKDLQSKLGKITLDQWFHAFAKMAMVQDELSKQLYKADQLKAAEKLIYPAIAAHQHSERRWYGGWAIATGIFVLPLLVTLPLYFRAKKQEQLATLEISEAEHEEIRAYRKAGKPQTEATPPVSSHDTYGQLFNKQGELKKVHMKVDDTSPMTLYGTTKQIQRYEVLRKKAKASQAAGKESKEAPDARPDLEPSKAKSRQAYSSSVRNSKGH